MASIVTDVLKTAGHMEREEILSKLTDLTKRVDEMKLEVFEAVTSKYVDFLPSYNTSEQLTERSQTLSNEMQLVMDKIENEIKDQLNMSTGEFQTLTTDLQEANGIMAVLKKMTMIQEGLELVNSSRKIHEYSTAAQTLDKIQCYLNHPVHDRENEIKILKSLYTEYKCQREKLIYDLGDLWNDHIIWNVSEKLEKQRKSALKMKNELKLKTKSDTNKMKQVVIALEQLGHLDNKLKSFGDKLLEYLIKPIVNQCTFKRESQSSDLITLSISASAPDKEASVRLNLIEILLLDLFDDFLNLTVPVQLLNETIEITLMEKLGAATGDKIIDFIIKNCLADGIPSNLKNLDCFGRVADATKTLQEKLVTLKFIREENTSLLDYIGNINVLFANKKSQEILVTARALMTSEIHDMTLVDDEKSFGKLPVLDKSPATKKARKLDIPSEIKLSGKTMKLPKCHISTCVEMIMRLAYETLEEAGSSSPECGIQLYFAIRNMFELFCSVFPVYHKETLKNLPQQTALHHNNCMYIAHHLMTLGHQFSNTLPAATKPAFVHLIPQIRRLGTASFMEQLTRQRDQLLEYLAGAGDFISVAENDNYFAVDRAIKQILHQLNHLQNVWQHVLPVNVYKKAIGTLLNSVLVEIINSITALEDISEDDGSHLTDLLTNLSDKSALLFQIPEVESVSPEIDLQKNVAKWLKFKELIFILKTSLLEISDRWAEGKGPIAHVFSSSEVKQLIRALFQNSERRTAVLSKIK